MSTLQYFSFRKRIVPGIDHGGLIFWLFPRELNARVIWSSNPLGDCRGRQLLDGVFSHRHIILMKLEYHC